MEIDFWNGIEWIVEDEECFEGVENIEKVECIYEQGNHIKVEYEDGDIVFYQNIHGTWGFPTRVE